MQGIGSAGTANVHGNIPPTLKGTWGLVDAAEGLLSSGELDEGAVFVHGGEGLVENNFLLSLGHRE